MSYSITVHEGELEIFSEDLDSSESISWDLEVADGYDIQYSVAVRSAAGAKRNSWIYLEPSKVSKSSGVITPSELREDGIDLPVTIEFVLDNGYSWFSPKGVRLSLRRASTSPSPPLVLQSPTREELERRRSVHSREKLDLLRLKHVVSEALDRCPESYEEVRNKLSEIRTILRFVED